MSIVHSSSLEENLFVSIAGTPDEIGQCLKLRNQVFVNEVGAKLNFRDLDNKAVTDKDRFDGNCKHLMVSDRLSQKVVATTRLINDEDARATGSFYASTQFDLGTILQKPGRFMEVGRTCIHPDYRSGTAVALLWQGITRMVAIHNIDYLIGCVSIPLLGGHHYANALMTYLRKHHLSAPETRALPRIPLPESDGQYTDEFVVAPPLLRAYLRRGAVICGTPYWNSAFGVADVLILLDCNNINHHGIHHVADLKRA